MGGRDWYRSSSGSSSNKAVRRSSASVEKETQQLGCISSVLHFFDFHQFQCVSPGAAHDQHKQHQQDNRAATHRKSTEPSNDNSLSDHHNPPPKGVEAPRNSLELQEGPSSTSSSSAMKEEDDDGIPFSVLQLVPLKSTTSSSMPPNFSDDPNSQGSKTPNLVARLMGLDLLPAAHDHEIASATSSPLYRRSSNIGKYHHHRSHHQQSSYKEKNPLITCSRYESGTRSLPDTPRISSARRSDVDPRLSLQVLSRENMCSSTTAPEFDHTRGIPSREALASSPVSSRRRRRDMRLMKIYEESKISPSKYAKEVVKQVKESVSRKFGADITNYYTNSPTGRGDMRDSDEDGRIHSPTVQLMRKINSGNGVKPPETTSQGKLTSTSNSPPSRSPRFRILKQKSGSLKPVENLTHKPPQIIPEHDQSVKTVPNHHSETLNPKAKTTRTSSSSSSPLPKPTSTKCKKASCERFTRKPKKAPPSETLESRPRKSKVVQGALVRSNQEDSPPSSSGRASAWASPYKQVEAGEADAAAPLGVRDDNRGAVEAEFRYVRAILERTGIETACYSYPCRPLDPSLFHALERQGDWYFHPPAGPIGLKSYRALLFDLADEVLAGLLKPRRRVGAYGADLVEAVWGRMKGFPGANCKTLQDIDALVGLDMAHGCGGGGGEGLEEELEQVVAEIEREVVESVVVAETAAVLGRVTAGRSSMIKPHVGWVAAAREER